MKITTTKELNNNVSIYEVISRLIGEFNAKRKFDCPICGKNDASINPKKNVFMCWSGNCTDGPVRPYNFLDNYYRQREGVYDFKELYKRIDSLLGTNLYKEFIPHQDKPEVPLYSKTYKVEKYCAEVEIDFFNDVLLKKRVLLKAGTGFGKSYMLAEGAKKFLAYGALDVDKVIFTTPRGSIVEEIGAKYGYATYYKNDVELPYSPLITATTHKAPLLVQQLEETAIELSDGSIQWDEPKDYLLIIDEAHLLLTSRNIVVKEYKDLRRLKQLIDRAKYVIFTSANTEHFYKACKDIYDIKEYINIERKTPLYNLERLEVKRTKSDKEIRNRVLIEDIIREKNNGNKVFLVHNNIKDLRYIEQVLNDKGVLAKALYSANKTSEEARKEYDALIKKSVLKCDVTLCTSVVDTGVNILEKKVTTILVQDRRGFDDVTTIQAFARVRVDSNGFNGNKGILYLSEIEKREERHDKLHAIDGYLDYYTKEANNLQLAFNTHMFNNYDVESYESYKDIWGLLRGNDMYSPNRHLLYIECDGDYNENPRLAIDEVATYDKARREYLSSNYYNDDFIRSVTEEISTKEIIFTKDLREKEDKQEKKEGETFSDVLLKFIDDIEYNQVIMDRYITNKAPEEDPYYIGYLKTDYRDKFNKLDKRIKAMIEVIRRTKIATSELAYVRDMYEAYALASGKKLVRAVQAIEYPIYNKIYVESESYEGLGDPLYIQVRKSFDKAVVNRNKLTDRAIELFTIERLIKDDKKYYYDDKDRVVKRKTNDKVVKLDKEVSESMAIIELVYSISEKKYINLL